MRVFIFSDLNLVSINQILKKYCPQINEVIFTQIQRLAWEESIEIIEGYKIRKTDFIIFWFSRSNLFRCQMLKDNLNIENDKFIKDIFSNALNNINFFMSLGLNTLFFVPSKRAITTQDFELQNYLEKHSRSWEYYAHELLEKNGIRVIYESDFMELNHFSQRLWYAAKNPFSPDYMKYLGVKILEIILNLNNQIKVVAFDLDDTIWGGVIGEDGIEGIRLGGHDMKGELFLDIQRVILNLKSKGILIGVLSKNNLEDALGVFQNHNEMLIKENDLDFIYCNWEEKFINLKKASTDLNISIENFAFIDNSYVEREKMLIALPQVRIIELPEDQFQWGTYLSTIFNIYKEATKEDKLREKHYKIEKLREQALEIGFNNDLNLKDINKILEVNVQEEKFDIVRIEQLFSRTNQFNLSTRRLNRKQIISIKEDINKYIKIFRVVDKFGDYGICAVYCAEIKNKTFFVTDLAISCRALGRGVEEFVFKDIVNLSITNNLFDIKFNYFPTKKNKPVSQFLFDKGISLEKLDFKINK